MTRAQLQEMKDYYSAHIPSQAGGSEWVQVPRAGLLDLIDACETAWKEVESLEGMNHRLEKSIDYLVGDLTKERDQLKHRVRELEERIDDLERQNRDLTVELEDAAQRLNNVVERHTTQDLGTARSGVTPGPPIV